MSNICLKGYTKALGRCLKGMEIETERVDFRNLSMDGNTLFRPSSSAIESERKWRRICAISLGLLMLSNNAAYVWYFPKVLNSAIQPCLVFHLFHLPEFL